MGTQKIEIPNPVLTYEVERDGFYVTLREPRKGQFIERNTYVTRYVVTVTCMGQDFHTETFNDYHDVDMHAFDPHNEERVRAGLRTARDEEDAVELVAKDISDRLHTALFNPPTSCDHGRTR